MKRIWKITAAVCLSGILLNGCGIALPPETVPPPSGEATADTPTPPSSEAPQPIPEVTQPIPGVTQPMTETTEPDTTAPEEGEGVSLLDFLQIAREPVGSTMYIWGGGWNEEDTGAGIEAVTPGISPRWAEFAAEQDSSYDYRNHRYQIHDGLDCSGFVGWAVYNVLETESGKEGYVSKATGMAQELALRGLGEYIPAEEMTQWLPGDIMSMKGHVWISLGMCSDGSVLLLHASPPGVIFSGTSLPDGGDSRAVELARQIMQEHYPRWYSRYPDCSRSHSYLEKSSAMRWSDQVLQDPEGLRLLSAEEVAEQLFTP